MKRWKKQGQSWPLRLFDAANDLMDDYRYDSDWNRHHKVELTCLNSRPIDSYRSSPSLFHPGETHFGGVCRMFVGCNASAILRVYWMRQFILVVAVWLQRKKVLLHVLTTLAWLMGFRPQKLYRLCSLSISALIIWGTLCLPIFLLLHRHPSSLSRSLTEHFCCLSQASVHVAFSLCLLLLLELFQGRFVSYIRHTSIILFSRWQSPR